MVSQLAAEDRVDSLADMPFEEEFSQADEFHALERDWTFEERDQYRKLTDALESDQLGDAATRESAHHSMLKLLKSTMRRRKEEDERQLSALVWQVTQQLQKQLKSSKTPPAYVYKLMGNIVHRYELLLLTWVALLRRSQVGSCRSLQG